MYDVISGARFFLLLLSSPSWHRVVSGIERASHGYINPRERTKERKRIVRLEPTPRTAPFVHNVDLSVCYYYICERKIPFGIPGIDLFRFFYLLLIAQFPRFYFDTSIRLAAPVTRW